MGERGPAGKPPNARAGHRTKAEDEEWVIVPSVNGNAPMPPAEDDWHPRAKAWYESLDKSGQRYFFVPSDWTTAAILCENVSRELKPQPILVTIGPDMQEIQWVYKPMSGPALNAFLKGCTQLLATIGDRRRAQMELQKPPGDDAAQIPDDISGLLAQLDGGGAPPAPVEK